jgi:hypothetical protein
MTLVEFTSNPMAPVAVISLAVFIIIAVVGLRMDCSPTPEYTRLMAEHAARMAEWEAGKPARMAQYLAESQARHAAYVEAMNTRIAARAAQVEQGV